MELTLEQCLERASTHNADIRSYGLASAEAEQGVNEALGAFLPTLTLGYNYNELSNGNSGERDTDYLDQDSHSYSVRLTQPLFTGFSGIAGLKRAHQLQGYRQAEEQYIRQQVVRNVKTSFYSSIQASQRVSQWRASVQRLERQKKIAAAWVEQRLAPRLRLLETEVELSNARHQLIRSESEQKIASAQLRQLLAFESDQAFKLSGDLPDDVVSPCSSLEQCLSVALEQRPDLKLAQFNIELARQDARAIMARNLPQVQLEGGWTDYSRSYDDSRYADDDRDYYSVTLNVTLRPFQGGRNLSAWRKQQIAVNRYEQQLAAARYQVASDVETRFQQLQEARARITNAQDTLNEARSAYEVANRSTELGVSSLDDLLNAELRLTRAEINLIDSQAAAAQSRVQLDFAVGEKW
ncbi:MAG: TolC family protein [Desulfuromonadaceae bacterium]|nr:TolC family protein [Desulfuromonadaceae bacterium]